MSRDAISPTRSLLADVRPAGASGVAIWSRRAGLGLLLVIVVLGACGFFGVHSATTRAGGGGYTLSVTYAQVARAGLDVPFRIEAHAPNGFDNDVELAISSDYFRMFELQGTYPDPTNDTNDGRFFYMTFAKPPSGHDFVLDFDLYIQPSSQIGKKATVELLIHRQVVATTSLHTWLLP